MTKRRYGLINHKIVSVERAASDLRRALPVILGHGPRAVIMMAAERLAQGWLKRLSSFSDQDFMVGLSGSRANILHIPPRTGTVSLVKRTPQMTEDMIRAMADPADDLQNPMMGPFQTADICAENLHEAGLKLCKIARMLPAALFSTPITVEDARSWAAERDLLYVDVADILDFDQNDAAGLKQVSAAPVPLAGAEKVTMVAFRPDDGGTEHFALLIGDPNRHDPVLTRIHSECFTGDLLGSLKCDCGEQLRGAIRHMDQAGGGVLLYLAQEGRGIGLINKLRAYALQNQGFDTVDANERLGFYADERIFEPAAQMLKIMGFSAVRLLTNNPLKVSGLEECGIEVKERIKHSFPSNAHNDHYLKTKKKRSGHLL